MCLPCQIAQSLYLSPFAVSLWLKDILVASMHGKDLILSMASATYNRLFLCLPTSYWSPPWWSATRSWSPPQQQAGEQKIQMFKFFTLRQKKIPQKWLNLPPDFKLEVALNVRRDRNTARLCMSEVVVNKWAGRWFV